MVRQPNILSALKKSEFLIISNSKTIKISSEQIMLYEMKYERNSPILFGLFAFADFKDILGKIDLKDARVQVYFNDAINKTFFRYFKVFNVVENYDRMKNKQYLFYLIDEISYKLSNIYISKSFNMSKTAAFKQILGEQGIYQILSENKLKVQIDDDSKVESFVVQKGTSVLDFFISEFNKIGYSFYQTRDGFYVKSFDDLLPSKLQKQDSKFVYATNNQLYKNMIYEFHNAPMSSLAITSSPNSKTYYFDPDQKKIVSIDKTYNDIKDGMTINNNNKNLQTNIGSAVSFQNRLDSVQHINNIRESYLHTFKLEIIVNGHMSNDINKIFEVDLPGHKGNVKSQLEGNVQSSGNYVSLSVVDKLMGDKLIQKVTLGRSDSQK